MGRWWPNFIQAFRIYDYYLRRAEGVVARDVFGLDHFALPLADGDGILLTPNHCRYADPLVLGWPARKLNTHLHAMASWHLFNTGAFDQFALRRMGAFSLCREQTDRRSLDFAIGTVAEASRPLVVFPEGAAYRTNDFLKPLLDGVTFIARAAARRAAKQDRRVVMIPVALKYLCLDPYLPWADAQLLKMERDFGWRDGCRRDDILVRLHRAHDAYLGCIEARFGCHASGDSPHQRRQSMIQKMLGDRERAFGKEPDPSIDPSARARSLRVEIAGDHFSEKPIHDEVTLRNFSAAADAVLELASYPEHYIDDDQATDSRVVETIQRMQAAMHGKSDASMKLKAIIQFDQPVAVPAEKAPRGETDPLLIDLDQRLRSMMAELSGLSNRI